MRKVAIFVGIYLVAAFALGLAYGWTWAAFVILGGLVPTGALWFGVSRESYLEWDANDERRHYH